MVTKKQIVPKLLLQASVRELHNEIFSPPEEGRPKEEIYADNHIIISDWTLRNILPLQLINMTCRYKVMCGCECCVYVKIMHSSLLS